MLVCDKCGVALTGGKDTYGSYRKNLCSGCYLPKVPKVGYTALIRAAERGDYVSVEKLIQYGADVNAKNEQLDTALILVSCKGHVELATLLLSHGADPNQRNIDGSTALDEAVCKDKKDLVKLLLVNGADPNLEGRPSGMDGLSCLTTLGLAVMKRSLPMVNTLLHYNADPNERMSSGETALYAAAADGCGAIVNALLKSGADADIGAYNNLKPIDIATRNHCTEVVELLRKEVAQQSLLSDQPDELQGKHSAKLSQQEKRVKVNDEKVVSGKITHERMTAEDIAKEVEPHTVPQIPLQVLLSKLNNLTGLHQVKAEVTQIINFLRVQ